MKKPNKHSMAIKQKKAQKRNRLKKENHQLRAESLNHRKNKIHEFAEKMQQAYMDEIVKRFNESQKTT